MSGAQKEGDTSTKEQLKTEMSNSSSGNPLNTDFGNPTTPQLGDLADKRGMEESPNILHFYKELNTMDKFFENESPFSIVDGLKRNAATRSFFPLSYSPLAKTMGESDSAHSSFLNPDTSRSGARYGFRISHYGDDMPYDNLSPSFASFMPDSARDQYDLKQGYDPKSPSFSLGSNSPLFDKLYYSPANSSRAEKSPFSQLNDFNHVSNRQIHLNLTKDDYEPDSERVKMDVKRMWNQNTKMEPANPSQSVDDSKVTVFHLDAAGGEPSRNRKASPSTLSHETAKKSEIDNSYDEEDDSFQDSESEETSSTHSYSHNASRTRTTVPHRRVSIKRNATSVDDHSKKKSAKYDPSLVVSVTESSATTTHQSGGGLPRHPCNCKKSRCLKLYCECFAADLFCNGCNCVNCHNDISHRKERDEAKQVLLQRNANAFKPRVVGDTPATRTNIKGCNCRKTGCVKKYCECFQCGIPCGPNCRCVDCKNTEEAKLWRDAHTPAK